MAEQVVGRLQGAPGRSSPIEPPGVSLPDADGANETPPVRNYSADFRRPHAKFTFHLPKPGIQWLLNGQIPVFREIPDRREARRLPWPWGGAGGWNDRRRADQQQ